MSPFTEEEDNKLTELTKKFGTGEKDSFFTLYMPTPQNGQRHTICQQKLMNCLSVFDHFVELALKGLNVLIFCVM